ncbi:internalin N-terminal domain-containing protein [Listeria ivanovii]|uniref:internalin N-terminal domain-containing protein n=1 Tax=Listeria ivanovii TaxID=1638 RepID=UPI001906402E|nr:internalin [Listeria ivanovii]MBK1983364.1 internalin [Listeria ivanovii subsp. londoniensis]
MELTAKKNWMKIWLLVVVAVCLCGFKLDVSASEVTETYPLHAPIIDAFPDEDIANWVALATGKDSVDDVITQDDLDGITHLTMEGVHLTGEQLSVFNNEVFPNMKGLTIDDGRIGALPVFTAFPNIEQMILVDDYVTSFPDANYPSLTNVDLSQNDFSDAFPMFIGMDALQNINLFDCNITNVPLDAWSNLQHIGENDNMANLSGNHITEIPDSFYFNEKMDFPITALNEIYTFEPITIQQGEAYSIYLPIVNQFTEQAEISLMGEFLIDGTSQGINVLAPTDYYVPIPTEALTTGIHNIELYVQDYYGSHFSGKYSITVTVE